MTGASRPATAANLARGLRGAAPPSWRERFLSARDRLFGNPAFRRWAAATPLLRGIARRRARAVFDLTAGFVYSQVLQACVRLRLFDLLAEGPQSVAALAPRLGLSEEATRRLLAGAAALELVTPRAGHRGRPRPQRGCSGTSRDRRHWRASGPTRKGRRRQRSKGCR